MLNFYWFDKSKIRYLIYSNTVLAFYLFTIICHAYKFDVSYESRNMTLWNIIWPYLVAYKNPYFFPKNGFKISSGSCTWSWSACSLNVHTNAIYYCYKCLIILNVNWIVLYDREMFWTSIIPITFF